MAHEFIDQIIYDCLNGSKTFTTYLFVDIMSETPIYITSYPEEIEIVQAEDLLTPVTYSPEFLEGVSPPSRTGTVSQEIQRFKVAQGLGFAFGDAPVDFVRLLGPDYHNSMIYFRALIIPEGEVALIVDSPIIRTEGLLKGLTRSVQDSTVTVEFSNSYGKLNQLNELRTTPGSLKRRDSDDTTFDRAHVEVSKKMLDWGVKN